MGTLPIIIQIDFAHLIGNIIAVGAARIRRGAPFTTGSALRSHGECGTRNECCLNITELRDSFVFIYSEGIRMRWGAGTEINDTMSAIQ